MSKEQTQSVEGLQRRLANRVGCSGLARSLEVSMSHLLHQAIHFYTSGGLWEQASSKQQTKYLIYWGAFIGWTLLETKKNNPVHTIFMNLSTYFPITYTFKLSQKYTSHKVYHFYGCLST